MKSLDLDDNVISWTKKHGIKIPYKIKDKDKNYVPDFLIEESTGVFLEEVKGYESPKIKQAKLDALKKQTHDSGYKWRRLGPKEINNICKSYLGLSYRMFLKEYKNG